MLWSALGALTAMWLMFTPALWPEYGARSGLAAAVGVVALVLSFFGIVSARARWALASLGVLLGLANFALPADLGLYANFATSGVLLLAAGMAPTPTVVEQVEERTISPETEADLRRAA